MKEFLLKFILVSLTSFCGLYLFEPIQYIGELLLFSIYFFAFVYGKKNRISSLINFLILVFIIRFIFNIYEGNDPLLILRNTHRVFIYCLVPVIIYTVSNQFQLKRLILFLTFINIFACLIYFFLIIGIYDGGYRIESDLMSGQRRIVYIMYSYIFTIGLTCFSLFVFNSYSEYRFILLASWALAFFVTIDSFFRTTIVGYTLITLFLFLSSMGAKNMITVLRTSSLFILVSLIITLSIDRSIIYERMASAATEITEVSGTFASRVAIWLVRYESVTSEKKLFGHGFIHLEEDAKETIELMIFNPTIIDSDNGYAAILVALGPLGFLVFLYVYLSYIGIAYSLRKDTNNIIKALSKVLMCILLFNIFTGFVKDYFIWHWPIMSISILIGVWGSSIQIKQNLDKKNIETN